MTRDDLLAALEGEGDAGVIKTPEEHFIDWEGSAFGFGCGTGEEFTIPALKAFLAMCNEGSAGHSYNHDRLSASLGGAVSWLLINALCRRNVGVIEYGVSPRYGWLTEGGVLLRDFVAARTSDRLIELVCSTTEDYVPCYPDVCNCGDRSIAGPVCPNPFWPRRKKP